MIRIAKTNGVVKMPRAKNVLGGKLEVCSKQPMTGFFRDGCCNTGPEDVGSHTVCVVLTEEFLDFSKSVGNDLSTPNLQWGFPGLQTGNRWCLCAPRWQEALDAGFAPKVVLAATQPPRTKARSPIASWTISRRTPSTSEFTFSPRAMTGG
jgi:uncharacterized protein